MLETLGEMPLALRLAVACAVVVVLMLITFWVIRRFAGGRLGVAGRGRQPRLAVIDAAAVDGRRRLVLIRRDNVEHLLLIGGPADVVVEQNIVRAVPVPLPADMPAMRGSAVDAPPAPRAVETPPPRVEPAPRAEALLRPPPAPRVEPGIRPPEVVPRSQPISRVREPAPRVERPPRPEFRAPQPLATPERSDVPVRSQERAESVVRVPAPEPRESAPPVLPPNAPSSAQRKPDDATAETRASTPASDASLTDVAQRLEAALRRPGAAQTRETASPPDSSARQPNELPAAKPEAGAEGSSGTQPNQPQAAKTAQPKRAAGKSVFENLEDEMASLLGRSSDKP